MSDRFTEVATEGWGSRIGGSLMLAVIGLLLVPVSIALLYWNEGRAVEALRALQRGAAALIEVAPAAVDPQAEGRLVHLSGLMQPTAAARDPAFGVTADGLIRLSRRAEMYQWKEQSSSTTHESVGGSKTTETTYTYQRVWSEQAIESGKFRHGEGHRNPPMPVQSATFDGSDVRLGAYRVDPPLLGRLASFAPLQPSVAPPQGYQLAAQSFYRGSDPGQPEVGDLRVSFAGIPAQTVSVVAAQAGGRLTAYRDRNGYAIVLAAPGVVPGSVLLHDQLQSERSLTWMLRGVGFAAMVLGFVCIMRPLAMLFAVLPPLEWLVGGGTFLVALTLAAPITLVTIGVAWVAHRPLLGGILLAAAVGSMVAMRRLYPRRGHELSPAGGPSP